MSAPIVSVWTGTGSISIALDYSSYLERIASALETIAAVSTTTGIRTVGAYDWTLPTEIYSYYYQDLALLTSNTATLTKLFSNINTVTSNLPKFV